MKFLGALSGGGSEVRKFFEGLIAKLVFSDRRLMNRKAHVYKPVAGRVAYVMHNTLPYSTGGYATRGHGLALGLVDNGFDVICISRPGYPFDVQSGDRAVIPSFEKIDGISYLRVSNPPRGRHATRFYLWLATKRFRRLFKSNEVELVVAATNYVNAIPAAVAARDLGLPFFYEVRGFWEISRLSREPGFLNKPRFKLDVKNETLVAISADEVFTLTESMRDELVCRGVSPKKITLLPNSCDLGRFVPKNRDETLASQLAIPEGVVVIGYIGTFVQYEGLDDLARACVVLVQRGGDFRLLLVGNENTSGSDRGHITEAILELAKSSDLAHRLIMPGRIPHDQVESYYSLVDIAAFPRKPQPVTEMVSPMKPLEALAMEKAVVASSVRALSEMIVDQETGLIFEKGNVEDLADKLERLILDPDLRRRLGKAGRIWVEQERTWLKTGAVAAEVLNRYSSRNV